MNRTLRDERIVMSVVGVLTLILLMWHAKSSADMEYSYRAPVLVRAEHALETGNSAMAIELMGGSTSQSNRRAVQS